MAINVSIQYNGGFLPDVVLLTCWGNPFKCQEILFCLCSLIIPPTKRFDIFSP